MNYVNKIFYNFLETPLGICLNLICFMIGFYKIYKKYLEDKKWKKTLNEKSKEKNTKFYREKQSKNTFFEKILENEKNQITNCLDSFLTEKNNKLENMIGSFKDKSNIIYFKIIRYKTPQFNSKELNNQGLKQFYYASLFAGLEIKLDRELTNFSVEKSQLNERDGTLRKEYFLTDLEKIKKYNYSKKYKLTICVILDPVEETMISKLEII